MPSIRLPQHDGNLTNQNHIVEIRLWKFISCRCLWLYYKDWLSSPVWIWHWTRRHWTLDPEKSSWLLNHIFTSTEILEVVTNGLVLIPANIFFKQALNHVHNSLSKLPSPWKSMRLNNVSCWLQVISLMAVLIFLCSHLLSRETSTRMTGAISSTQDFSLRQAIVRWCGRQMFLNPYSQASDYIKHQRKDLLFHLTYTFRIWVQLKSETQTSYLPMDNRIFWLPYLPCISLLLLIAPFFFPSPGKNSSRLWYSYCVKFSLF